MKGVKFEINNEREFFYTINRMFDAAKEEWGYDIIDFFVDIVPVSIRTIEDWRRVMNALLAQVLDSVESDVLG